MIKYYSTLGNKLYDTEPQAKFAEENMIDKYFREIESESERLRRARNLLYRDGELSSDKNSYSQYFKL